MKFKTNNNLSKEIQSISKYYCDMQEVFLKSSVEGPVQNSVDANSFQYYKVDALSSKWLNDEKPVWELMASLFVGISSVNIPVSVLLNSDGKKVSVYLGSSLNNLEIIKGVLEGVFPQVVLHHNDSDSLATFPYNSISQKMTYGGFIKGNPTGSKSFDHSFQIDSVIKGMGNKPWEVSVFAFPFGKVNTFSYKQEFLTAATLSSEITQVGVINNSNAVNNSYSRRNFHADQYAALVNDFCSQLDDGLASGEWVTTVNFSSCDKRSAQLLGGLMTSSFYGEESYPEPVHAVYAADGKAVTLVNGMDHSHFAFDLNGSKRVKYPLYSTLLSSRELAVYGAFPTIDTSGISVNEYVDFDVNRPITGDVTLGSIIDSGRISPNSYQIDSNELNRHCLVVGLTGSGKTNTIKSLINSAAKSRSLPMMVIEPAKKEYWELYKLGFDDLQIYSVGSSENAANALCINPFERSCYIDASGDKKTVPIQTHIDFVYAAFKASFIMYTPMPYILERAIYSIYEDCGWDIHNNTNINEIEVYPTIEDLYYKIPKVVIDMGYDQRMRNDLIGSLQARINSMRIGSKGDTLNVERSYPMHQLFNSNVIVELEDIGDDDVKAFIISLLLVNLLEYRRQQEDSQRKLEHLVLIEEAHRLLKNIPSGTGENADPRGAAVEFFCNLLAELRSKGQGFIVADQIPSKLAPDLIKNTNLKIVHRTVAEAERTLIGGAMHMTDLQIDSLSSLKQGVAAVYSEGDTRPKLVKSLFAEDAFDKDRIEANREQVLEAVHQNGINHSSSEEYSSLTESPRMVCRACGKNCNRNYMDLINRLDSEESFVRFANSNNPNVKTPFTVDSFYLEMKEYLSLHLTNNHQPDKYDMCCSVACMMSFWDWHNNRRLSFIKDIVKRIKEG